MNYEEMDVEEKYGGLLLQKCREAVEKHPEPNPHVEDWAIDDMVGWVMLESGWLANREAAEDCIRELFEQADSNSKSDGGDR